MSHYCFAGKIAVVDLSTQDIQIEDTCNYENGFLGGRGLNQHLLMELEKEVLSPFDSQSVILFGSGRLVGTGVPGAVRLNVDSRNVFTGGIGSSNMGGDFSNALKSAGFDIIAITGKSEKPVYLFIEDATVEIRDATQFWGKVVLETGRALKTSIGDDRIQFVCIGPAGEKRAWTSAILDGSSRAAGRCGLGAVLGDKKVKAIVTGSCSFRDRIKVANSEELSRLIQDLTRRFSSSVSVASKRRSGTVAAIPPLNRNAAIPVHNFADEYLADNDLACYLPEKFDEFMVRPINSCVPCPIRCQHLYESTREFPWPQDKLEANTVWDFGPRLGLTKAADLLECHALCSQYGLDMDSTASTIAWAMDCFEKGILTSYETDNLKLQWGNSEAVFSLIKKIAYREGFGNLLAEGSLRASQNIGKRSSGFAYHIKGQDLIEPMRSCKGWALGVAVSPRGGTHTRGAPQTEFRGVDPEMGKRIWGIETAGNPQEYDGKASLVIYYERFHAVLDSLGLCYFTSNWSSPDLLGPGEIAHLCTLALGEEITEGRLMHLGERILTLEKIYNLLHTDFGKKDDQPPESFLKEAIKTGPFKGEKLDADKWDEMLSEYYALHGWNHETGFPREQTLKSLNLEKYSNMLKDMDKLGS